MTCEKVSFLSWDKKEKDCSNFHVSYAWQITSLVQQTDHGGVSSKNKMSQKLLKIYDNFRTDEVFIRNLNALENLFECSKDAILIQINFSGLVANN